MTLIHCPECKSSISSQAETCPKCGAPIKEVTIERVEYKHYGWWTFIFFLIAVAGLVMLFEGKLIGILLLFIGILLIVVRFQLWSKTGRRIR